MKLSGMGTFYAMLYDDRCDIYRTEKDDVSDGTTDIFYQAEPKYTDVKCRISFVSDDRGSDSDTDRAPIRFDPKLFCAADVDIQAGDYLIIRRYYDDGRLMRTYKGTASLPSMYTTHQEIFIRVDEEA